MNKIDVYIHIILVYMYTTKKKEEQNIYLPKMSCKVIHLYRTQKRRKEETFHSQSVITCLFMCAHLCKHVFCIYIRIFIK